MLEKIIEYDKRLGVPSFKGWEEREVNKNSCSCEIPDLGLTIANAPYCRKCNLWIDENSNKE